MFFYLWATLPEINILYLIYLISYFVTKLYTRKTEPRVHSNAQARMAHK